MYLSRLHLRHWRVYADTVFEFHRPTSKRPITLVGAMNGHGKTSFLMALYLGLFGKYGLRHCEGFRNRSVGSDGRRDNTLETMRAAMAQFRRLGAPPEEPTEIELVFSPASSTEEFRELRVLRRWFFTAGNKPKAGESFETLEIHVADARYPDGRPLDFENADDANDQLERRLFPAHLTPAFFFDGEQAAELIETMGDGGLRRAVEVMFGDTLLKETAARLQTFIANTSQKGASKGKLTKLEAERDQLESEIASHNRSRSVLQQQRAELRAEQEDREQQREDVKSKLVSYGSPSADNVDFLQNAVEQAEKSTSLTRKSLADKLGNAGLAMAVSRFNDAILSQLEKEHLREEWEQIKDATLTRKEAVIAAAMPEPAENDPLVGNLAEHVRQKLKQRFLEALDVIYNPPDPKMAKSYVLGHVKGDDARERMRGQLAMAVGGLSADLKRQAREYRDASSKLLEANDKLRLAKDKPSAFRELLAKLDQLNPEIQVAERRLGELNSQIESSKTEIDRRNKRLGEVREELKELGPDQLRVAIADRAKRAYEEFSNRLEQISATRLEEVVTEIFNQIADRRFKGSRVRLIAGQQPSLVLRNGKELPLAGGSGFERRTFAIAFCLALARITGRRIPLVIDTPVGNAASDYRLRALQALAKFDTDQIIILTHDEEVRQPFLEAINDHVGQKLLVKFDSETEEGSSVYQNEFFTFAQ